VARHRQRVDRDNNNRSLGIGPQLWRGPTNKHKRLSCLCRCFSRAISQGSRVERRLPIIISIIRWQRQQGFGDYVCSSGELEEFAAHRGVCDFVVGSTGGALAAKTALASGREFGTWAPVIAKRDKQLGR